MPTKANDACVVRGVILALLDARDFLAYQLTYANGGMTDAEFYEIENRHLAKRHVWNEDNLLEHVKILQTILGSRSNRIDIDVVSTVFRCSLDQACKVLARLSQIPLKQQNS